MTTLQAPYIGSKISLVSKLGIRYEGILYTVNPAESTIALAKVRCFGTENRPTHNPIAGRDNIYEYIVFKASDIRELTICEGPKPLIQFDNGLPYDPAIVKLSLSSAHANNRPEDGDIKCQRYRRSDAKIGDLSPFSRSWQTYSSMHKTDDNYQLSQMNARPRMSRGGRSKEKRDRVDFDVDYDFERANKLFCETVKLSCEESKDSKKKGSRKEMVSPRNYDGVQKVENATEENDERNLFYNKNTSFFDKISYRATENFDRKQPQRNWSKEYMRNEQTFGEAAVRSILCHAGRRCVTAWRRRVLGVELVISSGDDQLNDSKGTQVISCTVRPFESWNAFFPLLPPSAYPFGIRSQLRVGTASMNLSKVVLASVGSRFKTLTLRPKRIPSLERSDNEKDDYDEIHDKDGELPCNVWQKMATIIALYVIGGEFLVFLATVATIQLIAKPRLRRYRQQLGIASKRKKRAMKKRALKRLRKLQMRRLRQKRRHLLREQRRKEERKSGSEESSSSSSSSIGSNRTAVQTTLCPSAATGYDQVVIQHDEQSGKEPGNGETPHQESTRRELAEAPGTTNYVNGVSRHNFGVDRTTTQLPDASEENASRSWRERHERK